MQVERMKQLTIGKHLFLGKKENKVVKDVKDCGTIIDVRDSRTGTFVYITDGKGDIPKTTFTLTHGGATKVAQGKQYLDYMDGVYTINDPRI